MLKIISFGVGNEEGRRSRRGRKTEKLNHNLNPDQYQYRALDHIPTYFPPIILPNPCRFHIVCLCLGSGGSSTQASDRIVG